MAQKTEVIITDDIDGSPNAATVVFGWDGLVWQIDLSRGNREEFREAIDPFLKHAEPVRIDGRQVVLPSTYGATNAVVRPASSTSATYRLAVRNWWCDQPETRGLPPYRTRGRIPEPVYQAYEDARRRR